MQEAVDECRVEAEDLVEDMSKKITREAHQRREIERILCRLQVENTQLKVSHSPFSLTHWLALCVCLSLCTGYSSYSSASRFRKEFK